MELYRIWDKDISELPLRLQQSIKTARRLIDYRPMLHLGAELSPHLYLSVPEQLYDLFEVTDDYPIAELQILSVPLNRLAELTDVPLWVLEILYLDLNNYITSDFHNALSSLLDLNKYEAEQLLEEGYELSSPDTDIALVCQYWHELTGPSDNHADFIHYIEMADYEKFTGETEKLLAVYKKELGYV